MKTVTVSASKTYDVVIGAGLIDLVGQYAKDVLKAKKITLVTDSRVDLLYSERVKKSLENEGYEVYKFVFPEGEESKSQKTLFSLLESMAATKMTRSDAIVALGGGVVGDLAGFAAAVYLRGIPFIQIPTTLLACVDSSVGGKTAVNLESGKNLAGAFWQPEIVLCDTETLNTLDKKTFADGMAEVIKYGVIRDKDLFSLVKNGVDQEKNRQVIYSCVSIKSDIVSKDERESGIRKILNFGHTVGHAIEKCSNFSVSHGSAVAIGMVVASRAAYKRGFCESDITEELISALEKNGLPVSTSLSAKELAQAALSDKKMSGDTLSFIVPKGIGNCEIIKISSDELISFISDGLG